MASGVSERILAIWTSTRTPPSREREDSLTEYGYWISHDTMGGPSTQRSGVCSEARVALSACLTSAIPYRLLEERIVIRPRLRRGEMRISIQWPLTINGSMNVTGDLGSQCILGRGSFLWTSSLAFCSSVGGGNKRGGRRWNRSTLSLWSRSASRRMRMLRKWRRAGERIERGRSDSKSAVVRGCGRTGGPEGPPKGLGHNR